MLSKLSILTKVGRRAVPSLRVQANVWRKRHRGMGKGARLKQHHSKREAALAVRSSRERRGVAHMEARA
eukprot:6778362-Prymnesium_polylepis.1